MNTMPLLILAGIVIMGIGILWWSMNASDPFIRVSPNKEDTLKTNVKTSEVKGVTLDLSNKGLTAVTADIFTQTQLTELNLSNNTLTGSLQAEVRNLQNLKVLNLSNNQFTGVPAEVGQLQSLEILDLSNNRLTGLPNELGNLSNLKQLILSGNDYSPIDLAAIRERLPPTVVITVD